MRTVVAQEAPILLQGSRLKFLKWHDIRESVHDSLTYVKSLLTIQVTFNNLRNSPPEESFGESTEEFHTVKQPPNSVEQ